MKMFKNVASVLLLFSLIPCITQAADDGLTEQQTLPFKLAPEQGKTVTVAITGDQVTATLPNKKSQNLSTKADVEEAAGDAHQVGLAQVGDFNFDGLQDVAMLNGNGYGGVNLFYRLFLWDKAKQQFSEFNEAISNPSLNVSAKELHTAQRDGPKWYSTTYRVDKGRLYPAIDTQMVGTEGAWDYYTFKNPAGKVVGHKVVGDDAKAEQKAETLPDAHGVVITDKAVLYDKPKAAAQTKMYVIKGDKVTLLDWQAGADGDFGAGWFLARYEGKKTLEKWIQGDAIGAVK